MASILWLFAIHPPVNDDGSPVKLTEDTINEGLVVSVWSYTDNVVHLTSFKSSRRPNHYDYIFKPRFAEAPKIVEEALTAVTQV